LAAFIVAPNEVDCKTPERWAKEGGDGQ